MTALTIILCAAVIGLFVLVLSYRATIAKRNAVIAAQVTEIAGLRASVELHATRARTIGRALREKSDECDTLNAQLARAGNELAETRARLAPFIVKRARDSKGHYISEKAA